MLEFTKLDNNIYIYIMKKNCWLIYLYEEEEHTNIFKVMKFNTIKDVLGMNNQTISNFFHGLIKPRGVLKYCVLYQSIPL